MASSQREILSNEAVPIDYTIQLEPNIDAKTFTGSMDIRLRAFSEVQWLQLNSVDLRIKKKVLHDNISSLRPSDSKKIKWRLDISKQILTLKLGRAISGKEFIVHIDFNGTISKDVAGFYSTEYKDSEDVQHKLLVTHMEPSYCRRVFPCFDEPIEKASFTMEVVVPSGLACLSNMPLEKKTLLPNGKVQTTFKKTPLMSTYLVAIAIGRFDSIQSRENTRVPIKLYAPLGLASQGEFALDIAAKGLRFFEKTFSCDYPLPKLDLVAIPNFEIKAMENWGLIVYRSSDLLVDTEVTGKRKIAEITLHEVAHQWFGNLVTIRSWDSLWLKEGFANWMSWFATHHFFPEWSFDDISYNKGSYILRMISTALGEDVFLSGVRLYLQRHRFANASTNDLWDALHEVSKVDISKNMSTWTRRVGFLVIFVEEVAEAGHLLIKLTQRRYLSDESQTETKDSESPEIYPISVIVKTKSGIQSHDFLTRHMSFTIDDPGFFKINVDHVGFYRTAYSMKRLQTFGLAAKEGLLSVEDRIGILADASALSISGQQDTTALLDLLLEMREEPEYLVWHRIIIVLRDLRFALRFALRFKDDAIQAGLMKLSCHIVDLKLREIGFEIKPDDDGDTQNLKQLIYETAVMSGNQSVISKAKSMFKSYCRGNSEALHPALRNATYVLILGNGVDSYHAYLKHLYDKASSEEEKSIIRGYLDCIAAQPGRQRTLNSAFASLV
ncbi:uncharacterized protein N7483_003281 [Penicillium malachiteum]|uniref:uncharacterized protein n=1 Tax=Penicillium malachiteum TaxID=1324776 RepID=UPI0025483219|nr:uncharacterized protein N7483_003281 [Penicillium malachiteum]KAJ5728773.1 hypothetical protein N7483_003281 [Penicillium malachiteum]